METQSSFDLNRATQTWRENLANSPAFRRENLNELESHLRDAIATWQTKGLSQQEAFTIATQRIGAGRRLEAEFAKVNRNTVWFERLLWMLIGVQAWMLINGIAGSITQGLLLLSGGNFGFGQGFVLPASASTLVRSLLVVVASCSCWFLLVRKSGRWAAWFGRTLQRRSVFLMCCIAAPLLLMVTNAVFFVLQWYGIWRVGSEVYGRSSVNLSYSQILTQLLEFTVTIVLVLALARNRSVEKRA